MVQVRKLVLAMAAASALSCGAANALQLGELTLKSAVNQPLLAEIELLDVRDLTAAELSPSLAPAEEFAKAGVDRQAYLNDLSFTPVINRTGRSLIRITSSQPLSAPMVKFLVQVRWPSGRLMRDYSMLLDPSRFSPQAAEAAGAATPAVSSAPTPTATPTYRTGLRDTLWEIAARNRQGASVQQTMLAIQALNPDAFLDGNINRLKTGQVLRLPDTQQSTALGQGPAVAEVARQNAAWREGRRLGPRAQQLDATRRPGPGAAPAVAPETDKLSLVSGNNPAGGGAAGDARALTEKLAVTQENLDSTRRDNEELRSRMTDLQSQLDKLQKLIQLKNDQLAKLQAAGADIPVPAETVAPADSTAPAVAGTPPVAAGQNAAESPAMSAELVPPPIEPAEQAVPPADAAQATPAPLDTPLVAEPPMTDDEVQDNELNSLLASPMLLGLVGGAALIVVLALLLLLARRRKAQLEAEKHTRMARALAEESDYHADPDLPESSFDGLERPSATVQLTPAMVAASVAAAAASAGPATFAPPPTQTVIPTPPLKPSADTDDALFAEVQQSIARGRLNHAAELLERAVEAAPGRADLRLKLMEVYGLQGDRDGFIAQERELPATGSNQAQVEQLKNRFPAMLGAAAVAASAAAIAAELDAQYVKELLQDEPGAADSLDGTFDSDFDLSLDDPLDGSSNGSADELDFDTLFKEQSAVQATAASANDDLDAFDLDMADERPLGAASPADIEDQLAEFDESLDLAKPDPVEEIDDLDLPEDFDLSLADDAPGRPDALAADIDQVNAELDKFSQSLGQAPAVSPFLQKSDVPLSPLTEEEDEFDFLDGGDESATKLDLARAYIEMGDNDGARDILDEVLKEGSAGQQGEARAMLGKLA